METTRGGFAGNDAGEVCHGKKFPPKTQTPPILPGGKIEGASFSSSINHTR
jgi:hypothetical protein